MKKKTINAVITKKVNEWLETVEDEKLKKDMAKSIVVTGGCIASMLLREKVSDFDVYFTNRGTAQRVAEYYVKRFKVKDVQGIQCAISVDTSKEDRIRVVIKSAGVVSEDGTKKAYQYFESHEDSLAGEYVGEVMNDPGAVEDTYEEENEAAQQVEDKSYRPVFMSTNAITLSNKLQVILRFYGQPDEIHENFDYVHCSNYWTKDAGVVLRQEALEAILAKELRYVGSRYPICSLIRMRKFIKRDWTINAGQIVKMCMQISKLDLCDIEVLEEQLTGVDVAYFNEVIHLMKEKNTERAESAYLIEIIDRMF